MRFTFLVSALLWAGFIPVAQAQSAAAPVLPAASKNLTLPEAEQRALARNPLLSAAAAAVDAADADAEQAGFLPNPEISYSRENLGNDQLTGLDGPASSWLLSQRFSLAGQRSARSESARGEAATARAGLLGERAFLRAEVRSSWVDVLAAQQRLAFAEELEQVTVSTRDAVALQVRAGKVSPVEVMRSDVALAALQRRVQAARLALLQARQHLAALQGLAAPDFGALPDALPASRPLPSPEAVTAAQQNNPLLRAAAAKTRAREGGLKSARAGRFPDITLSAGQTRFEAAGESAWQMGVSFPLPLFDRNQGAMQAAQARLREAQVQQDAAAQGWQAEIDTLYPQVAMLAQQLSDFEKTVLPASSDAFNAVNKGYRFGKFGVLDVLDTQRALIDTRFDYLDTVTRYHRQRNRLDALLGLDDAENVVLTQEKLL